MGAHLSSPVALLVQFINFAILVGILVKFGRKPFKDYLKKRHESVKERIDEAERLLEEAAELKTVYEGRLSALKSEIEAFRASAMGEMEKERAKILDEAHRLASRIREQARRAYEQELKEAMTQVRSEVSERTIKAAEAAVKKMFKKEDHDRMVEEFIDHVRSIT
jgi:F-type H+-transporting ATPase subunit b